jgi:hypothetical protein
MLKEEEEEEEEEETRTRKHEDEDIPGKILEGIGDFHTGIYMNYAALNIDISCCLALIRCPDGERVIEFDGINKPYTACKRMKE